MAVFCCHKIWCWLDTVTFCRLRFVCDRHDAYIRSEA